VRNSETNALIDGVKWKTTKAFGNEPILMGETGGRFGPGNFELTYYGGSLENTVYFIEFEAPGYEPFRKRLDPADAVDDPNSTEHALLAYILTGDKAIKLKPLAKPQILKDTLEMDRFGAFIPGVRKAGNQQTFNALSNAEVEARLTMNWALQAKLGQSTYTVTLPKYDTADGPGGTEDITLNDENSGWSIVRLLKIKLIAMNRPMCLYPLPLIRNMIPKNCINGCRRSKRVKPMDLPMFITSMPVKTALLLQAPTVRKNSPSGLPCGICLPTISAPLL